MTYSQFTYASNFTGVMPAQITSAIGVIEAMYYGALNSYWSMLPDPPRANLRTLLENLLVAWYLANTNPESVTGVDVNGLPLSSKSIGGTSVTFEHIETQIGNENLLTNPFGRMAHQLMQSAPERMFIFV